MSAMTSALVAATALGSGVVGGVFFAFDAFVLQGLSALPGDRGAQAMRSINLCAVRAPLMTAMFGTAVLTVPVAVAGLRSGDARKALLLVGGAATYLVGVVLTTVVRNVPLNDQLAAAANGPVPRGAGQSGPMQGDDEPPDPVWTRYLTRWSRANRLRTVCGVGAAAALITDLSISR